MVENHVLGITAHALRFNVRAPAMLVPEHRKHVHVLWELALTRMLTQLQGRHVEIRHNDADRTRDPELLAGRGRDRQPTEANFLTAAARACCAPRLISEPSRSPVPFLQAPSRITVTVSLHLMWQFAETMQVLAAPLPLAASLSTWRRGRDLAGAALGCCAGRPTPTASEVFSPIDCDDEEVEEPFDLRIPPQRSLANYFE